MNITACDFDHRRYFFFFIYQTLLLTLTLFFFRSQRTRWTTWASGTVAFLQPLWGWTMSYLHMLRKMDGYVEAELESRSIFVAFRDVRGTTPLRDMTEETF